MNYLKRLLLWFLSGVALVLGMGAMLLAIELVRPFLNSQDSESISNPADLKVSGIEPVTITRYAAVSAVISNASTSSRYAPKSYELRFTQAGHSLFVCEPYHEMKPLAPGASAPIQLVCPEVERAALPGDVRFDLRVESAWRFR